MPKTNTPDIDIVDLMRAPYVLGGRDPATGLDCWSFVMEVRRRLGLETPDIIGEEAVDIHSAAKRGGAALVAGWVPVPIPQIEVGDVIVLPGFSGERTHAAIYLGGSPARAAHFNRLGGQLALWQQLKRYARECWRTKE